MTNLEAKQALSRKLNINYTDVTSGLNGLFYDADLQNYVNEANRLVWDFKNWEHTEGDKTFTISASDISDGYVGYPSDYVSGSIFLMIVDGEEWYKTTFRDLLKYKDEQSGGDKKIYGERKRYLFFNTDAISAGSIVDFYGKLKSTILVNDTELLPFSQDTDDKEVSGNNMIVQIAYSIALGSDKKKDSATSDKERNDAFAKLSLLWDGYAGNRMTSKPARPMFDSPDLFSPNGTYGDTNSIGRFYNN